MEIVYLPVTPDNITLEGFSAIYDLYLNTLDITYRIDGITYRFTYEYNKDTLPDMSAQELSKENVRLDEQEIDFYVGERWLGGHFLDGVVLVRVGIFTSDAENISLDAFDMVFVASIE